MPGQVLRANPATVSAAFLDISGAELRSRALASRLIVEPGVFFLSQNLKVLDSVVRRVFVSVMNLFIWFQQTANVLFHYQAMFQHVAFRARMRVVGSVDNNVAIMVYVTATFPSSVALAYLRGRMTRSRTVQAWTPARALKNTPTVMANTLRRRLAPRFVMAGGGTKLPAAIFSVAWWYSKLNAAALACADYAGGILTGHVEPPIRCANPRAVSTVAGLTLAANCTRLAAV